MPDPLTSPASSPTILARSRAETFDVGTNRRGEVSGAGWLYALPSLEYARVVCHGAPTPATLSALVRVGRRVVIVETRPGRRRRVAEVARARGWTDVLVVGRPTDPIAMEPADLVVRLGRRDLMVQVAGMGGEDEAGLARRTLALTPAIGEVRSAIPADDVAMRMTIARLHLEGTIASHPRISAWEARLRTRVPGRWRLPTRTATIVGPSGESPGPPAYLRDVATAAGTDLAAWGWGVAARGDYDSQKVLVLLRPPGAPEPTGVVKITRSATHAARLENEADALGRLAGLPMASGRAPQPWFAGGHAGRAILGESLMEGLPFTQRATWAADCPSLDDALRWLADFGAATRVDVPASQVAEALLGLLDRYVAIHRPAADEATALRRHLAVIGDIPGSLPVVQQHGDPGIWNLLVDGSGTTVFLDWEAAEPHGLPLWDLLYLFRSYAIAASRRRDGVRDRLDGAARHLLGASPLADRLVQAFDHYRAVVGLPVAAVAPLVYGCWIHRSLKESTRLPAARLHEGQFVRLVRRMLADPDAPTLRRLSGGAT